jgi:hypothetical protein
MYEEKEYLDSVHMQAEEEKLKNKYKKIKEINERLNEYDMFLEKKKNEEIKKVEEKVKEKELVTLDFKSEENLNKYKEYISRLNDNVENNMKQYKQFIHENERPTGNLSPMHKIQNKPNFLSYQKNTVSKSQNLNNSQVQSENGISKTNPGEYSKKFFNNSSNITNLLSPENFKPLFINSQRSDITNKEYFSKNNNDEYHDYRNAKKIFLNYNKEMIDNKERNKANEGEIRKKNNEELMKEV